jgi:hypothetical protein
VVSRRAVELPGRVHHERTNLAQSIDRIDQHAGAPAPGRDGPLHPRLPFSHDRETASERPVIAVGRDDHSRLRRDVVCDVDATRHPCPPVHRANGIEHLILDEVYSRRYLLRAAVVHSTPTYGATGSRSRGRLRDLDEVRVSRSLAPLDAIAGDAHVVRRGGPGQVDLGGSGGGRGESGGGARVSRVRSERPGRSESREGTEVRDGISGANPEPVRRVGGERGGRERGRGRGPDLREARSMRV